MTLLIRSTVFASIIVLCATYGDAQWVQSGLDNLAINALAVSGTKTFAGTSAGLFVSTDDGVNWSMVNTGSTDSIYLSLVALNPYVYAGMMNGGIVRSTDNGSTWSAMNSGLISSVIQALTGSADTVYAGTPLGLHRATTSDTSWTKMNDPLIADVRAMIVSGPNLIVATYYLGASDFVYSSDGGGSWISPTVYPDFIYPHAFLVSGTRTFAGIDSGVAVSLDHGVHWSNSSNGLPRSTPAYSLAGRDSLLAAGMYDGVHSSSNNGNLWHAANTGMPNSIVISMAVAGDNLLGGTNGRGVWRRIFIQPSAPVPLEPLDGVLNQSTTIIFRWNSVVGAENFHLDIATDSLFSNLIYSDAAILDTFHQVGPLANFTQYFWRVTAINITGESASLGALRFMTKLAPPMSISVIGASRAATLSWSPGSAGARIYRIYRGEGIAAYTLHDSTIADSLSYRDSQLTNGRIYYYRLTAVDNLNHESDFSDSVAVTPNLEAPINVGAVPHNSSILVSWSPGNAGASVYRIYRGAGTPVVTLKDSVAADSLSYRDNSVQNGVEYFYKVTAVDDHQFESAFSSIVSATPYNVSPVAVHLSNVDMPSSGRVLTTQLTFSDSGSYDPDGTIDSVYWFVDDVPSGRLHSMTHTYGPGSANVTLIVRDNNGAYDTSTATVTRSVFRMTTGGTGFVGLSLLGDSLLYAVAAGDALYRLDINGNTAYTLSVGGDVLSTSSVAYDTTAYLASTDRNLYAFSKFGAPAWPALPLGGILSATAAVDSVGNRLYIGVQNRNFFAVNRTTGLVAWSYFCNAPITRSAVVTSDRKLIFSSQTGTVYGFDLANLPSPVAPAWTLSVGDTVTSSPAIDQDGYIYVGTKSGKIVKISMQQGSAASIVWQTPTGGSVVASPVIDGDGILYAGSLDSKFYAIRTSDGSVRWSFQSSGPIQSTAALSNSRVIYFGNDAGRLYAVDSLGNLMWKYQHPAPIQTPLLYKAGTLYAAGQDAVVLAFFDGEDPFQSIPSANAPAHPLKSTAARLPVWGTFQGNNQRTGVLAPKGTTGVAPTPPSIPVAYALYQNYPNPFNPSTQIRYDLPAAAHVLLKVFDVLGREVATLVDGREEPGVRTVTLDASRLPSGVYFYRLQAGAFTDIRKMVYLR